MTVPDQRLEQMIAAMQRAGRRLTPQRLAVLRLLAQGPGHPSVEQLHAAVAAQFPSTSLATTYKTVAMLKELGQVLELAFADGGCRYDGRRPYPHPHVICTRCGAIEDPEYSSMDRLYQEMTEKSGFAISHHRLDFFGLCPRCRGEG